MALSAEDEHKRLFLADVQHELIMLCCRTLTELTVDTSDAFLSVARRGRTPPCPPPNSKSKNKDPHANDDESETPLDARRDEFTMHEEIYRSVRSAIAASGALGHRSCHALWGPWGCGKHRILRLVAKDCAQRSGTLVLYLDGDKLSSDEDALRAIAQQMLEFLKSSNSDKLRAADWSIRTGTFEFGKLFHFDKHMIEGNNSNTDNSDDNANEAEAVVEVVGTNIRRGGVDKRKRSKKEGEAIAVHRTVTRRGAHQRPKASLRKRTARGGGPPSDSSHGDESQGSDTDTSSEGNDPQLLVTTTTAWGGGGAASALPALQRALLLMKSYGTNLVICIRRVERFGVWCDQLLYVLSGLMHESDGRGGGMSLVMTSSTPDIRYLEKRLSSRLTCETRFVPLLPWSTTRIVRATLTDVHEQLQRYLDGPPDALSANTAKRPQSSASRERIESPLYATAASAWRCDTSTRATAAAGVPPALRRRRPRLRAAAAMAMAAAALAELQRPPPPPPPASHTRGEDIGAGEGEESDEATPPDGIAEMAQQLAKRQRGAGATAGRVVAAAAGLFASAACGRVSLVSKRSRVSVLTWFTLRLRSKEEEKEEEGHGNTEGDRSYVTAQAPAAVRSFWLSARSAASVATNALSLPYSYSLEDTRRGCQLLECGYASREAMLVLIYTYLRHEAGVQRTVGDLMEDIASSLGTRAAAALDPAAFRAAIAALHRWRILSVSGEDGASGIVALCGSAARVREFLQSALRKTAWCESVVGFDAKELMRLRTLV